MTPGARPLRWVPQAIGWLLTAVALVGPIRADEPAATAPGWHAEQHAASSRGIAVPLTNPIGCNVKWKAREGHWMPPEACDLV